MRMLTTLWQTKAKDISTIKRKIFCPLKNKRYGTIHKVRQHFFCDFCPPQLGANCTLRLLLIHFRFRCFCNQFSFQIHLFLALVCLFFSTENLRPLSPLRCINVIFLFILQFMVFRGLTIKVTKLPSPCSFNNIN